jgi:glyoxylase-like metal-dependent hydrolase (beta-lactamase superfamily II)/acetolactate synthase regulatory subunit/predicted amino acid-binding ACT domain protein
MALKSFVTNMPDKAGAFLRASEIIAKYKGNVVRVSYNKAVDLHTLFIDVQAAESALQKIENDLSDIGYIKKNITETRVIEVSVKIPDRPGAMLPVLDILNRRAINISYMNSSASDGLFQNFKFGLLIEKPAIIKILLDEISQVYHVDIIECDSLEENLDNTVFYIRLANEMQKLLGISTEKTMQFIAESNRILQVLQSEGENAGKVFDYIRRFAYSVSSYRGDHFKVNIQKVRLSASVVLYSIQPYCGSNTYLLQSQDELVMIDTGYAIYAEEMLRVFHQLLPDWDTRKKRVYITHADVDHCGLLAKLSDAEIMVNEKSAENFKRQLDRLPDYREQTELHLGYSRISQIVSDYAPPDSDRLTIWDGGTAREHNSLIPIGRMKIGDLDFTIWEGSGGHLFGEMIYVCREVPVVFTGDILVNIKGFSKERAEFNSLAPYLMKSVNVEPKRAAEMRRQVAELIRGISEREKKPCLVCGGHGPVSLLGGKYSDLTEYR